MYSPSCTLAAAIAVSSKPAAIACHEETRQEV